MKTILTKLRGDKYLWLIVICLSMFSILAVYSSTGTLAFKAQSGYTVYYLIKHLLLLVFGIGLMYLASLANYKIYSRIAQLAMYLSVPLLIYTLVWGSKVNEASRWITLPGIELTFQTSDLAKMALIMYTARMLSRRQHLVDNFREGFVPVVLPILITCGLIAPANLSSACVLFFTCLILLFIGRMGMKYIAGLVGSAGVLAVLLGLFIHFVPEGDLPGRMSTWKSRVESFNADPGHEPFQVEQAKIAIAQGGLFGVGPGNSAQRNFLPASYSDYIFAIIIEEYGLILGGLVVVFLYLAFLYRCMRIVIRTVNPFGALLAIGLGISLTIQAFVNMAVVVNLLPVTGLTLPLISMGGTSIWFTSVAIGIILSVSRDLGMDAAREYEQTDQDSPDETPIPAAG